MTTTTMRESTIGDAWIHEACMLNPVQNMDGNTFCGGPARINYPSLFNTSKNRTGQDTGKYEATFLFPAYADLRPLQEHITNMAAKEWPDCYSGGQIFGVKLPLRDQGEKANEAAYTPGLKFLKAGSKFRPVVLDRPPLSAPLTDGSKIYSGLWVIPFLSFAAIKNQFGRFIISNLNFVQVLADDKPIVGGGVNPEKVRQYASTVRVPTPIVAPKMDTPAGFGYMPALPAPGQYSGQPGFTPPPAAGGFAPASYAADPYAHLDPATRQLLGL